MNKSEIRNVLISNLKEIAKFYPHVCAGIGLDISNMGESGYLRCVLKLSDVRGWLDFPEYSDPKILAALDELTAQRKIKIFMCASSRNIHWNDVWIKIEVGKAVRRLQRFACNYDVDIFYYFDSPLSKADHLIGGMTILKISEKVKAIRARRDRHFGKTFGTRDFPAEEKLYREIRQDNAELNTAILTIAKDVTDRKRKGENV